MERTVASVDDLTLQISERRARLCLNVDQMERASILFELGNLLSARSKKQHSLTDLDEAIDSGHEAKSLASDDDQLQLKIVNILGVWLEKRFNEQGRMVDLELAINLGEEQLNSPCMSPIHKCITLSNISNRLKIVYQEKTNVAYLDRAIESCREAVAMSAIDEPAWHPIWYSSRFNLMTQLRLRHEKTYQDEDINECVAIGENLMNSISREHSKWGACISSVSNNHHQLYKKTGNKESLERAIVYQQQALLAPATTKHDKAVRLNALSILYSTRHEDLGDGSEDLDTSIKLLKEALELVNESSPSWAGFLGNMGNRLHSRDLICGSKDDLRLAINYSQQAFSATPLSSLQRIARINNLGQLLQEQFRVTQRLDDLIYAIKVGRQAVSLMEVTHPERSRLLSSLAAQLGIYFGRTQNLDDLNSGIDFAKECILRNPNKTERVHNLARLANLLSTRFEHFKSNKDIDEAISLLKEVTETTPTESAHWPQWISHLGTAYCLRYESSRQLYDLESGIECVSQSVQKIGEKSVSLATNLNCLARLLQLRYEESENIEDLTRALEHSIAGWNATNSDPLERIKAGLTAGSLLYSILPQAASVALKAGCSAEETAQLIEAGRCIITGLAINARSDITDLKEKQPELYEQYNTCRNKISQSFVFDGNLEYVTSVASYEALYEELDRIEEEIRQIPGFHHFQLPPDSSEMMLLAQLGPILIFNVSQVSSEVIIVTNSTIRVLPLPDFTYEKVKSAAKDVAMAGSRSRRHFELVDDFQASSESTLDATFQAVLEWLWDSAVEPALREVSLLIQSNPRRVWWMAGGLAGHMPFHAAGYHRAESVNNTLSQVVSSYTPTFRVLRHARLRSAAQLQNTQIALITMQNTSGHASLDIAPETNAIHSAFPDGVINLPQPSKSQVLSVLPKCQFVHFACHGSTDPSDPSRSGLWLNPETELESGILPQALLSISALDDLVLQDAYIAFLSACSTASLSSNLDLLDEAIHLANSFQAFGYRHVIGSMWGACDDAAGDISKLFYARLNKRIVTGERNMVGEENVLDVAEILHQTTMEYRKGKEKEIIRWGVFAHFGC
ncbi:hypothetical protein BP5796_12588 [Coleophoma crateriformis]|uniref:CHAT domain-containing protein n=1 Tax=Coleophoma crateriformis TaxID=565419 RepID=A0A3D8Q7W9_9HELO|nr:hypothetical protein BP5796_12588 [Coleophoma crateriformis]